MANRAYSHLLRIFGITRADLWAAMGTAVSTFTTSLTGNVNLKPRQPLSVPARFEILVIAIG